MAVACWFFDVEGAARRVSEEPDVWTDGSLVDDRMSGVSSAGAGCFTYRVSRLWANWKWGHWDDDVGDGSVVSACRGFCSVPGLLQTVQRTELWGVILALQANDGVHLGVDNLGVVRHVGRILDGRVSSRPCELLPDGDLLLLIERMLHFRGLSTARIAKVKVMRMRLWFVLVLFVIWIDWGTMVLMRLLILVVGGCRGGLLTLG